MQSGVPPSRTNCCPKGKQRCKEVFVRTEPRCRNTAPTPHICKKLDPVRPTAVLLSPTCRLPFLWYMRPDSVTPQYDPALPGVVGVTDFITNFILYGESHLDAVVLRLQEVRACVIVCPDRCVTGVTVCLLQETSCTHVTLIGHLLACHMIPGPCFIHAVGLGRPDVVIPVLWLPTRQGFLSQFGPAALCLTKVAAALNPSCQRAMWDCVPG